MYTGKTISEAILILENALSEGVGVRMTKEKKLLRLFFGEPQSTKGNVLTYRLGARGQRGYKTITIERIRDEYRVVVTGQMVSKKHTQKISSLEGLVKFAQGLRKMNPSLTPLRESTSPLKAHEKLLMKHLK
ncbi:hypothetical protein CL629_02275 [bacterium]|nr:hypothetical protein [bacterium]|tara:strand:- start:1788 stop:2183 length:396 start_codon:yes stop_codon:yes gene_type:complete